MSDTKAREAHQAYQKEFFDKNVGFFTRPIPEDVEERTALIVEAAGLTAGSRVLDVGTGTGVLIKFMLAVGVKPENIVACDLSQQMIAQAQARYPQVNFHLGDVTELPSSVGKFDAVFFNACFANLFDPKATLEYVSHFLTAGGCIVISQPVGRGFVEHLHEYEPQLVPHHMPTGDELNAWCTEFNLHRREFRDEGKLYLAVLTLT